MLTHEVTFKMSKREGKLNRRDFISRGVAVGASAVVAHSLRLQAESAPNATFELEELTLGQLQEGMHSGKYSARSLTQAYLGRIGELDKKGPAVNAVLEINPDALSIADELDRERKAKGPRGPMHGIPVLIKDNIDTGDRMMTTAGSLALVGAK